MVSSPAQPASAAATTPTTAATAAAVMVEMLVRIVMMLLTLLLNTLKVEKLQCLFHSLAIYFSQQLRKRRKATTETGYPPSMLGFGWSGSYRYAMGSRSSPPNDPPVAFLTKGLLT
jgi:hypothetical protein